MPLPPSQSDSIQDAVIARAKSLGLSSYAIAQATGGKVSEDHVRHYLTRRSSMGSHKLQHVLSALGLEITTPAGADAQPHHRHDPSPQP